MTFSRLRGFVMKALKILAALVGIAVALVALLVAALWFLFDPQAIKTQAEQWVSQHTGRRLAIAGELNLVFYPRIGVAMRELSLSERDQPETRFAAIEQVRVGVPVMPLLSGRLEVEEVLLTGLDVRLVRFADGRLNVDDLIGGVAAGEKKPQPEVTAGGSPSLPATIRLAGVHIENARVAYRDEAAARETVLEAVRLKVGPLADQASGRLEFAADLREGQQQLHAEVATAYQLQASPPKLRLEGLALHVQGNWAGISDLNTRWSSVGLLLEPSSVVMSDSRLQAAGGLSAAAGELSLMLPEIRLGLAAGERKLIVAGYTGELKLRGGALPGGKLDAGLAGKLDADLDALAFRGENRVRMDETNLQTTWRLPTLSPLAVVFEADVDRLNLDRYLPKTAVAPVSPAGAPASAPAAGDVPVRLPLPADIEVSGKLRAGSVQVAGIKVTAVDLGMRLAERRLAIAPLRLELYGGRASGRLGADATGEQRFAAQLALDEVNLQPLLVDAAKTDILSGRGKINLDVTTGGRSLAALKASLAGSASLALRDGAIKGINLARSLRELKASLGSEPSVPASAAPAADAQTDFSDLTASFRIARGVARNDDLLARAPFLRLAGAGDVDLPNASLDYLAKVTVVNTSTGQDGKALDHLRGLTIPLRIRGPFAAPKFRLEVAGLAKEAAKEAAKAKLGEKLGLPAGQGAEAVREEAKSRLKEKVDERLKGLFGR